MTGSPVTISHTKVYGVEFSPNLKMIISLSVQIIYVITFSAVLIALTMILEILVFPASEGFNCKRSVSVLIGSLPAKTWQGMEGPEMVAARSNSDPAPASSPRELPGP